MMNKQIEEMAKTLCEFDCVCSDCSWHNECIVEDDAKKYYEAGYRKQSDVATDFFEEFEALIAQKDIPITITALLETKEYADFKKKWAKL
jgi:hypothetical protein